MLQSNPDKLPFKLMDALRISVLSVEEFDSFIASYHSINTPGKPSIDM